MTMDSVSILGVRVDNVTLEDALARVDSYLGRGGFHQLATINTEFVVLAQTHPDFMRVLNASPLNVPDGVGLLWASRHLGHPLHERVTGQELVDRIAQLAAARRARVFFLGAREGVAQLAARALCQKYPDLPVAGSYSGSPDVREQDEILARVNASRAQVLFVAYGPPKQELWIARNGPRLQVAVAMGVGGTFDTLAGLVPRAPAWMRRAGLEWTFRLIREPRRIRRQMTIPYFMWLILTRTRKSEPAG